MKFPHTEYRLVSSVTEALEELSVEGARVLSGGQSLLPLMAFHLARPEVLVDVSRLEELRGTHVEEGPDGSEVLVIGAATTHAEIERDRTVHAVLPCVPGAVTHIGHLAIRHLGTIGGSLAHADPSAEWPALCIALGAEVEIVSSRGSRRQSVEAFVVGPYQTTLVDGEIVVRVRIPLVEHRRAGLVEVARREGDFAIAGSVCVISDGAAPASFATLFGVEGTPRRVDLPVSELEEADGAEAEARVIGSAVTEQLDHVLSDAQADAAFRRHLAIVTTARAYRSARSATSGRRAS